MAYNSNKGPQHSGDIQYEGDPNDVQIDFENDQILLRTGGAPRVNVTNAELSASGIFHNVGNATFGSNIALSGAATIPLVLATNIKASALISGSSTITAVGSISSSGELAVSGAIHGTTFYGAGTGLTGIPATAITPAGSDTQIQFNEGATALGASANLVWDDTNLKVVGNISASATLQAAGAATLGSTLSVSGSSTLGAVTMIGTGSVSSMVATGSISGSSTLQAVGDITTAGALNVSGTITQGTGLTATLNLVRCLSVSASLSPGITSVGSISSSGDLAVTGAAHATAFYGDGSGLTGVDSVSGSARHYSTTGLETSGYLKVTGSSTLGVITAGSTTVTALSSSGLVQLVSITASADLIASGSVIIGEGKYLGIPDRNVIQLNDGNIVVDGVILVNNAISSSGVLHGTSISSSGDLAVTGAVHAGAFYGGTSGITSTGLISGSSGLMISGDAHFRDSLYMTGGISAAVFTGSKGALTFESPARFILTGSAIVDGSVSGSGIAQFTTVSASADVYVSGAVKAAEFFGDGSGLTGISAGSVSGSARIYSATGVDTSGYLGVTGSTTLRGLLSSSAALMLMGVGQFGSNVEATGSVTSTGLYSTGLISGSLGLHIDAGATFGSTIAVTGSSALGPVTITGTGSVSDIVATGSISGSSTLQAVGAATLGSTLAVSGTVTIASDIIHAGDADTYLRFEPDLVNLVAGGKSAIKLETSTGKIQLNNSNEDLDVQIMADNGAVILHADGATNKLGINTDAPAEALSVVGNISGSGTTRLVGSISGSGDIAVSGAMHAANFYGDGSGLTNVTAGAPTSLSGTTAQLTTGVETSGYLKVTGSSTLAGPTAVSAPLTLTAPLSSSATVHVVGATSMEGALTLSSSVTAIGLFSADIISGSGGLHIDAATSLGGTLNVTGTVGIGTPTALTALDVHHNPTTLGNDAGGGDVVQFGTGTTTAGKLYYLHSGSSWEQAAGVGELSGGLGMLAMALGSTPGTHGMLIRGFFDAHSYLSGAFVAGTTLYISAPGYITTMRPSGSTEIVRVLGTCTTTANVIYFNPSPDYLVIT